MTTDSRTFAEACKHYFSIIAKKFIGISPDRRMGTRTGLHQLDRTIRGLHAGKLYVVGGRPGDGKTSFATTITAGILKFNKAAIILLISTELDETEIILQIAEAYSGGIPVYPNGRTSSDSEQRVLKVSLDEIAEMEGGGSLQVVHQRSVTLDDISGWVQLIDPVDEQRLVVIVDQASRIKRNDEHGRRSYAIATEDMLNQLEQAAGRSSASFILLTQMNRQAELQKKPMLSNLKHSGAFEEFAHCVLLLEKCEGNGRRTDGSAMIHHDAIIHVAKNRHGFTGPIECEFRGESHHWTEKER